MATLEKPRSKKKKKTRHSRESPLEGEASAVDLEFPEELEESLNIAEIIHAAEKVEEKVKEDEDVDPGQVIKEEASPEVEHAAVIEETPELKIEEMPVPSAPLLESPETSCSKFLVRETPSQIYPTLNAVKMEQAQPFQKTTKLVEITVEPFSTAQLRELYSNNLLAFAKELEREFIETELNPSFLRNGDYLYHCLQEYLSSLAECRSLDIENERLKEICEGNQEKLWSILKVTQSFSGVCGDGTSVSTTVYYKKAIFNDNVLELVFGNFSEIRSVCCDKYVKNATLGALFKMLIDEEIARIQRNHMSSLAGQEFLGELKNFATASLFSSTSSGSQKWLSAVVSLLLDVATWPDHMFLLHHVLRCPPGIISWAAPMIQIPLGEFSTEALQNHVCVQHSLTVLHAILLPIARRAEFLDEILCWSRMDKHEGGGEWSFVDSDGEEDVDLLVLRENDLVRIFNQIPWKELFSLATKMHPQPGGKYRVQKDAITAHSVLQFFAFASYVVETIGMGLCTYNTEMYRQFTKRLARLIAHCVQYASGVYSIFQDATAVNDVLVRREFRRNLSNSSHELVTISTTAGAWQYLVGLPYNRLSPACIGSLYQKMRSPHFGDTTAEEVLEERKQEADYSLVQIFEANDISQEDLHYLLQTLANLASISPMLRKSVVADLLEIGFLRGSTKHDCSKIARDLISNLADECPELITEIILQFNGNTIEARSYGTYLLKRLPMEKWKPGPGVIDILEQWLTECPLESPENGMARIVINNMNWSYSYDGQLFLHRALHTRMALIIYQADVRNSTPSSNFITENVRNLVKDKSTAVNFHTWCWKIISVLKLHATDRENAWQAIFASEAILPEILELDHMADVWKGYKERRPLAIYLSSDEAITALRCLQVIFPLFLPYPESLIRNTGFSSFLHQIFTASSAYGKTKGISGIVELFGKMIVAQLMDWQRFGLPSPTPLILLWLQCLTAYKDFRHCSNCLYIIDLLSLAPKHGTKPQKLFTSLTREARITGTPSKSVSSFLSKANPIGLIPQLPVTAIWLGLMIFDVQQEIYETETGFWVEFVHQLSLQSVKMRNLDEVVKKVAKSVGTLHTQSADLVISRLIHLIIACPTSHTALVLLCQRFFALYLTKVPSSQGCVRDRLYATNEILMRRIRGQMEHARVHHEKLAEDEKETDEALSGFHGKLAKEFQTFEMWLDGKGFDARGGIVFQAGLINLAPLLQAQRQNFEDWNAKLGRQIPRNPLHLSKSPSQEYSKMIEKQLLSYDSPVPRQVDRKLVSSIELPNPQEYTKGGIFTSSACSRDFSLLEKYAKAFASNIQEMGNLDRTFGDLVKRKLVNEKETYYESVYCTSVLRNKDCSGAAQVRVTKNRVVTVESIEKNIAANRKQHQKLLNTTMKQLPDDLLKALLRMEQTLKSLVDQCSHRKNERRCTDACRIAFEILAKTLRSSMDFLTVFPPTNSLTQSVIKTLEHFMPFHLQQEGRGLVESMLKGTIFTDFLISLFTPEFLAPREFLAAYELTIASFGKLSDQEVVAVILGKFNMTEWLEMHEPDAGIRENLTHLILRGLKVATHRNSPGNDKILRLHLVQLFKHRFPQSFNSILRILFDGFTKFGISGGVLRDLLNCLFSFYGLVGITSDSALPATYECIEFFASTQKVLSQMDLMETIKWLSEFFRQKRKNDGIYGLFPRFKDLYHIFNLFMTTLVQTTITATIQAFPGASADQLSEWIWSCIRDVYEMWVIPVIPGDAATSSQAQGNWLKNQLDSTHLLPWSETTKVGPNEIFHHFARCTNFAIVSLHGDPSILRHVFLWYERNFSSSAIPVYITLTAHEALDKLPWDGFDPTHEILDAASLIFKEKHSEGSRKYAANVLKRVSWINWFQRHETSWNYVQKCEVISRLFSLFVPMAAYGDDVDVVLEHVEGAIAWEFVDSAVFTETLGIFSSAAGPVWCKKLHAELPMGRIEKALWKLLRRVSRIDLTGEDAKSSRAATKRLTFVKMVLQFLIQSVENGREFFTSKDGKKVFQDIFAELLRDIQKILDNEEDFPKEGLNILVEVLREIPQDFEEIASGLLVEEITQWEQSHQGTIVALLNAIAMSRKASEPLNALLDATIEESFRGNIAVASKTRWAFIQETMWNYMATMRPALIGQNALNCIHLYATIAFRSERDPKKRLVLMGLIFERLNGVTPAEENELKVALLWGFLCAMSSRECDRSPENSTFLIHITKRLIHMANEPDDWGKSVLSAIGITRLKRSKVLWKCLACYMTELLKVINVDGNFERERCALNVELQAKQYNPYREAIADISRHIQGDLSHQAINIASLLRKFYPGENVLDQIETLWT
uniref:Ectopic P granules protein 5 homolog n=1 Tax=Lutzomyia longipalpis TaxID=7200 RepID=A0A1B0CR84_LUTLO